LAWWVWLVAVVYVMAWSAVMGDWSAAWVSLAVVLALLVM